MVGFFGWMAPRAGLACNDASEKRWEVSCDAREKRERRSRPMAEKKEGSCDAREKREQDSWKEKLEERGRGRMSNAIGRAARNLGFVFSR